MDLAKALDEVTANKETTPAYQKEGDCIYCNDKSFLDDIARIYDQGWVFVNPERLQRKTGYLYRIEELPTYV
jgi:hypothetical protein